MAELTVKYTAPLPARFTSGTLEIKRPTVYLDAAGRKAQAYYRATIGADRSLTDVQTGGPLKVIAAAQGDPDGGYLDWVETLNVDGLPTPLRQAHRIPAIYTGVGVLDLHRPDRTVKLVDAPAGAGGPGGIQAVLSDGLTVTGDGVTSPLSNPGYDAWIGRFWRRTSGQESVLDTTLHPDRFIKVSALDFKNYTVGGFLEGFNAVFEGIITPKYSEEYTLIYSVDDACRIWLNDSLIVDNWGNAGSQSVNGAAVKTLSMGKLIIDKPYHMRVEWCQWAGKASATDNPNRLYIGWKSTSQPEQAIPTVGSSDSLLSTLPARVSALEARPVTTGTGDVVALTFAPTLITITHSIGAGYMAGNTPNDNVAQAWPAVLGNLRGWSVQNYGVDGSAVSTALPNNTPMVSRYATEVPDGYAGHVATLCTANDFNGNVPLGYPGSTDAGTLYGALLTMHQGIMSKAPGCMLHMLTDLPRWDGANAGTARNAAGWTMEQGRQAVRDVAAQLSRQYPGQVQLIDLGRDLADWFYAGSPYFSSDNLHPSVAGQTLIGQHLAMQCWGQDGETITPAPPIPPVTPASTFLYSRNFSTLAAGNLGGQDDWIVDSGSYMVGTDGLTINAAWSNNLRGAHHSLPDGAVRVRALVTSGSALLRFRLQDSNDYTYAIWVLDSGTWDWGEFNGSGLVNGTSWFPDSKTQLTLPAYPFWIEIEQSGGELHARVWHDGDMRLSAPLATKTLGDHMATALSGGNVGLAHVDRSAVVSRIEIE